MIFIFVRAAYSLRSAPSATRRLIRRSCGPPTKIPAAVTRKPASTSASRRAASICAAIFGRGFRGSCAWYLDTCGPNMEGMASPERVQVEETRRVVRMMGARADFPPPYIPKVSVVPDECTSDAMQAGLLVALIVVVATLLIALV